MPTNSTNVGFAPGYHHMSLLVLALTCKHATCCLARDTCLPTEGHSRSFRAQLADTAVSPLQGCHRTYAEPCIQHIRPHPHPINPCTRRLPALSNLGPHTSPLSHPTPDNHSAMIICNTQSNNHVDYGHAAIIYATLPQPD